MCGQRKLGWSKDSTAMVSFSATAIKEGRCSRDTNRFANDCTECLYNISHKSLTTVKIPRVRFYKIINREATVRPASSLPILSCSWYFLSVWLPPLSCSAIRRLLLRQHTITIDFIFYLNWKKVQKKKSVTLHGREQYGSCVRFAMWHIKMQTCGPLVAFDEISDPTIIILE